MFINYAVKKFLGSNTGKGFKGFYEDLLYKSGYGDDGQSVFILKGGPGTGKSTFIKKTAAMLEKMNCDVELLRCSGDVNSYDGVVSRMGGITVVDGTSPHCIDPVCPGVCESILNLGEFWDRSVLSQYSDKVDECIKRKKLMYKKAYHYLAAAGEIYKDRADILMQNVDGYKVELYAKSLAEELVKTKKGDGAKGRKRRAFATAVTSEGITGALPGMPDGELSNGSIYCVNSIFGLSSARLLEVVADSALSAGYDVNCYYCGFDSGKLEHITVPELGFMIVTSNEAHTFIRGTKVTEIEFEGFMKDDAVLNENSCKGFDVGYSRIRFDELTERAFRALAKASEAHIEMENYYVEAMDFAGLTQYTDFVLDDSAAEVHNNIVSGI